MQANTLKPTSRNNTMLYAIISTDVPNSLELRLPVRPQHLQRLKNLEKNGQLIIAGPHPNIDSSDPGDSGFSGSLIIAESESLDAATEWANADPYVDAGVYQEVTIKPFIKVLP